MDKGMEFASTIEIEGFYVAIAEEWVIISREVGVQERAGAK